MRRGFDGLLAEVRRRWPDEQALSGHLFLFVARDRSRLKVLWWSDGGLCLLAKRLEKGRFRLPRPEPGQVGIRIGAAELTMLLAGIDWPRVQRPKLYEPPRSLTDRR